MKSAIRCCISCILPCGALDVVRIVHANGRVQEISRTVKAGEIMKLHPKHVLKKPSSSAPDIAVLPPTPISSAVGFISSCPSPATAGEEEEEEKKEFSSPETSHHLQNCSPAEKASSNNIVTDENLLISDRYLSEILSEKIATQRERRRGRTGVWRPHLQSISEIPLIED